MVVIRWLVGVALVLAPLAACSDDSGTLSGGPRMNVDGGPGVDASKPVVDAAPPPMDAAPNPDPCVGRAICDSFESTADGAVPGMPWKLSGNTGTATVSTTRAFRGTHSLKLTTTSAQYQRAMITTNAAPLFPLAQNVVYGRMMVWLENAAAHDVHWNMIRALGPIQGKPGVDGSYNYGGQLDELLANYDTNGASTDCYKHSQKGMPIGKWVCFAWKFDGTKNDMHLYSDGGEITDMHVTNTGDGCVNHDFGDVWIAPMFTSASVGWESVQNDAGHTMYLDDVIMDSSPIVCP
jgi:hypothetical protein